MPDSVNNCNIREFPYLPTFNEWNGDVEKQVTNDPDIRQNYRRIRNFCYLEVLDDEWSGDVEGQVTNDPDIRHLGLPLLPQRIREQILHVEG